LPSKASWLRSIVVNLFQKRCTSSSSDSTDHALSIRSKDGIVNAGSVFQRDEAETARMTRTAITHGSERTRLRIRTIPPIPAILFQMNYVGCFRQTSFRCLFLQPSIHCPMV